MLITITLPLSILQIMEKFSERKKETPRQPPSGVFVKVKNNWVFFISGSADRVFAYQTWLPDSEDFEIGQLEEYFCIPFSLIANFKIQSGLSSAMIIVENLNDTIKLTSSGSTPRIFEEKRLNLGHFWKNSKGLPATHEEICMGQLEDLKRRFPEENYTPSPANFHGKDIRDMEKIQSLLDARGRVNIIHNGKLPARVRFYNSHLLAAIVPITAKFPTDTSYPNWFREELGQLCQS